MEAQMGQIPFYSISIRDRIGAVVFELNKVGVCL